MPGLQDLIGYGGYVQGQQLAQQQDAQQLQQVGALEGILSKVRAAQQQEAYRGALSSLGPNPTADQLGSVAAQFGAPKDIMAHADRQVAAANTREMAMARLTAAAQNFESNYQLRLGAAKTEGEKLALAQQKAVFTQQLQSEAQRLAGAAANYNFGTVAGAPPAPTVAAPTPGAAPAAPQGQMGWIPAPVGTPQPVLDAAAQIKANLAQGGPGGTVDLGVLPQAAAAPSAPVAAPVAPAQALAAAQPGVSPVEKAIRAMPPEIARLPRKMQDKWMTENSGGGIEETAKGIANYTIAPLSSFAMARPLGAQVMGRVMEINPNFDSRQYNSSNAAEKAFTSGRQGDTVRSFNVAINHLGTLKELATALDNGDIKQVNRLAQAYAEQTGETAPTNFDAAKKIIGDEISKAIIGSRGALGDREATAASISRMNSPKQLVGVMNSYLQLMNGQLGGLQKQYEASTRKNDFRERFLTPEGAAVAGGAGVPEFATEADAAKANLKPGTKVKIGGRPGTWQ